MNGNLPASPRRRRLLAAGAGALLLPFASARGEEEPLSACLPPEQWRLVEERVDKLLAALNERALLQGGIDLGSQPVSTSLAIMAFLSRGHAPGRGPYGAMLARALDFVLSSQDADGVFTRDGLTQESTYHHAMSAMMLGEVYGLTRTDQSLRVREAIVKALAVTRRAQMASPGGTGMRYFTKPHDADLSVTGAHFLFYRSAKNAEFDVPEEWINKMLVYVKSCSAGRGGFSYQPNGPASLAMTSVGLLFLVMTGRHNLPIATAAAEIVLQSDFQAGIPRRDYSLYYASLAMSQMGGAHWKAFYPRLVAAQLAIPVTTAGLTDAPHGEVGPVLSAAFHILSLTPPCQVLPIFQR